MNNIDKTLLRNSPNAAPFVLFMLAVEKALSGNERDPRSRAHRQFENTFLQLKEAVDLPNDVDRKAHILMRDLRRIGEGSSNAEDLIEDIENVMSQC